MDIPGLDQTLIRLTTVLPFAIEFLLVLFAFAGFGLFVYAMFSAWSGLSEAGKGQTYGATVSMPWLPLGQMLLGAALAVPLVIMWDVAGVFVAGGQNTYNILSYLPPPDETQYCERVTFGLWLFFAVLGLIAFGWSIVQANSSMKYGQQGAMFQAVVYFFGALACFFVSDVLAIVSWTFGIDFTFNAVCEVIGK